jgi:hypothetical protein
MTLQHYAAYLLLCLPLNVFVGLVGWHWKCTLRQHWTAQIIMIVIGHSLIGWAFLIAWLLGAR